jgi:hypothetical protein
VTRWCPWIPALYSTRDVALSVRVRPYMIVEGTLDECIRKFMSQPESQRHLYEIHTAPQSDLVSEILSGEHIISSGIFLENERP